jgi:hypothetical protein
MRVQRDSYLTWISGKAVALTWVGAFVAPFIGSFPHNSPMFWIALGSFALVALSIWQGFVAKRRGVMSDFLAMSVVPALLLVASGIVNVLAA